MASIEDNPEHSEGTALHLVGKGRKDILQILFDQGAVANQKDCMGKMVMSGLGTNEYEVISSMMMNRG